MWLPSIYYYVVNGMVVRLDVVLLDRGWTNCKSHETGAELADDARMPATRYIPAGTNELRQSCEERRRQCGDLAAICI